MLVEPSVLLFLLVEFVGFRVTVPSNLVCSDWNFSTEDVGGIPGLRGQCSGLTVAVGVLPGAERVGAAFLLSLCRVGIAQGFLWGLGPFLLIIWCRGGSQTQAPACRASAPALEPPPASHRGCFWFVLNRNTPMSWYLCAPRASGFLCMCPCVMGVLASSLGGPRASQRGGTRRGSRDRPRPWTLSCLLG